MNFRTFAAGAVALALAGPAMAETTLRIQTAQNAGDFVMSRLQDIWVPKLEAMSGGELTVELLPTGAVVPHRETPKAVSAGIIDGQMTTANYFAGQDAAFALFGDLIAAYDSPDQGQTFCRNHKGREVLQQLYDKHFGAKLQVIGCGPYAREALVATDPIRTLADIKGKKIGIPREYHMDGMPEEIETLWAEGRRMLQAAGAEIVDISLPHTKYALPTYYVIAPAEASSNLARYDGVRYGRRAPLAQGDGITEMYEKTRAEGFGHEVQRRIMVGTYVLSAGFYDAYYNRARKVRTLIKKDFEDVFAQGVDAILTPATPSAAFGLGEMKEADPVQMYLNDVFTVTVNLAGLPGISVPAGTDRQGLPLGLQLIGRPWEEGDLLNCAYALEQAAGFVSKPAKWW